MSENRIDALEVKIAFLEEAISTLSDEYYQQQLSINTLKLQNAKLTSKVTEIHSTEGSADFAADEKPPHY